MASNTEGRTLRTDGGQSTSDTDRSRDPFEGHRIMDVEVTSNMADGATVSVNGTTLKIFQHNRHVPVMAEIWVENEEKPLGTINTAKGETAALGGVDEMLAQRVDEIREMPVEEIPDALEKLVYRLNPSGREDPETTDKTNTGTDRYYDRIDGSDWHPSEPPAIRCPSCDSATTIDPIQWDCEHCGETLELFVGSLSGGDSDV